MGVVFDQGQLLGQGNLDIFLTDSLGNPANAYSISYAIYFVDPLTGSEVLIGSAERTPVNPNVGEYYAALMIPSNAEPGCYRIRWQFLETASSSTEGVVQEFGVVANDPVAVTGTYSACITNLISKMRVMTRDNCLAGSTMIEVDVDGELISISLRELYETIGDISPPTPER